MIQAESHKAQARIENKCIYGNQAQSWLIK